MILVMKEAYDLSNSRKAEKRLKWPAASVTYNINCVSLM